MRRHARDRTSAFDILACQGLHTLSKGKHIEEACARQDLGLRHSSLPGSAYIEQGCMSGRPTRKRASASGTVACQGLPTLSKGYMLRRSAPGRTTRIGLGRSGLPVSEHTEQGLHAEEAYAGQDLGLGRSGLPWPAQNALDASQRSRCGVFFLVRHMAYGATRGFMVSMSAFLASVHLPPMLECGV